MNLHNVLNEKGAESMIESNPDIFNMSFGEYFIKAMKKVKLRKMFQRIVKLDIMFKRGDNDDDKNEQTKNPLVTN